MNIEWIDQMIEDVVGVVHELYVLSSQVVFNDAVIDLVRASIWIVLFAVLGTTILVIAFRLAKLDWEEEILGTLIRIFSSVIVGMLFMMILHANIGTISDSAKKLTTPEWYALERIERLVK